MDLPSYSPGQILQLCASSPETDPLRQVTSRSPLRSSARAWQPSEDFFGLTAGLSPVESPSQPLEARMTAPPGLELLEPLAASPLTTFSTGSFFFDSTPTPLTVKIAPRGVRFLETWPSTVSSSKSTSASDLDEVAFLLPSPSLSGSQRHGVMPDDLPYVVSSLLAACEDDNSQCSTAESVEHRQRSSSSSSIETQVPVPVPGPPAAALGSERPAVGSLQRPSVGSVRHGQGKCKPCAFFTSDEGCGSGVTCLFCHLCQAGEKKRRKKDLKQRRLTKLADCKDQGELLVSI